MKGRLSEVAAATGGRLAGKDVEIEGVSIDSRTLGPGQLFVALRGERFDGHAFIAGARERGAAGALVEKAADSSFPQVVVRDSQAALTALADAWRGRSGAIVLGVGGSNGKTTTKELLAAILAGAGPTLATRGNLNNHIGVPLTLLRLEPEHRYAVVEMGANHPGEIAALAMLAKPSIALVTNAGDEHLEGFGDLAGVAHAEGEMYAALEPRGIAVMNADDPFCDLWQTMTRGARIVRFGIEAPADVRAQAIQGRIESGAFATTFTLAINGSQARVRLPLAGSSQRFERARRGCGRARSWRRNARDRRRPRAHASGCRAPAAEARPARVLADRRLIQRQPELGSRGNRRALRAAG